MPRQDATPQRCAPRITRKIEDAQDGADADTRRDYKESRSAAVLFKRGDAGAWRATRHFEREAFSAKRYCLFTRLMPLRRRDMLAPLRARGHAE